EALALLPLFLSRRAAIRAFVDASAAAISGGDTTRARTYQRLALSFLQPTPPRLLAIGGLSGSGKTTEALQRAPAIGRSPGAVVVRSDVERKRLAGIALEERMPTGGYTPEASARTYAAMLTRAERVLRAGHSVVLDAVFAREDERQAAEPPSGPRSRIQSAVLMTSRLCSITTTVLPPSTRRCSTSRSFFTSSKCRPVVGSSRM